MPSTNNPLELLVKISADTIGSKKDLQDQLSKLSEDLKGLDKIKLGISKDDVKALKDIANMDFSKLHDSLKKSQEEAKGLATITEKEFKEAGKKATEAIGIEFGKLGDIKELSQLKKELQGLDANIKVKFDARDAGKEVEELTATIEKAGVRQQIAFKKALVQMEDNSLRALWQPETIIETDNSIKLASQSTDRFIKEINKLHSAGKLTDEQLKKLNTSLMSLNDSSLDADGQAINLKALTTQANSYVNTNKKLKEEQEKQTKELKEQEALQEKIRKLTNSIITEQKRSPKGFGSDPESKQMLDSLQKIDPASKGAAQSVKGISDNFDTMKAKAVEAGRSSIGMAESFRIAMEKFPIWMAASTVFYQTVRGITDSLRQIVELDSQITVMRRVAGDGVNANEILQESVRLAGELGNLISDVNDGFIAFARQGYKGQDLSFLVEYATLLGNISDLSVEDASSTITAALKGFNMEISETAKIVDSLNEVDNNYAITTQQLAESLTKAAGASSTYGVSMQKNIGFTTAIGQVTRESGSVIGNSLKSIYSRINSISGAVDELDAIGISVKDMSGNMRDVELVLDELGGKWNSLSAEQQQNLGIQIAGRYQLSR